MSNEPPLPSIVKLVEALHHLDGDALADWAVTGDDEARDRLRAKVNGMRTMSNARTIDQFAHDQEDTVAEMMHLLDEWHLMLQALNRAEIELSKASAQA